MEAFVTTGTRIGTAATQSDVPVIVIGKPQFEQTPQVEVADYLKNIPAFTGAGNTNDTSTNGGDGSRRIDLRGLGSEYTLVMINGRRLAYASVDRVVDVNQIPVTAIDHIEVLTSGASAIYGTDAIGGVVNIITRKGQNGGELNAFYGDINFPHNGNRVNKTDLSRRQFAFSYNASEGKVDLLLGAQYFKQNGIYSSDFTWSAAPGPTSNIYPYRLGIPNNVFTAGATGTSNYVVKWKPGEGGRRDATSRSDFRAYDGRLPDLSNPDNGGDQFPFFLYTPLLRPEERYHAFAFTTYQLNDQIKLFGDVMYRYGYSYNQLAPAAVPVPALGAIVIPPTNYYNRQIFGAAAPNITSGGWRLLGLGPRLDTNELNGIWFNGGAEGKVADWNWRLEALFTQETRQELQGNTADVADINAELAKTTPDAFNPFSSKLDANAAVWGRIRRNAYTNDFSRLGNLSASVDGKLMDTAAGPVKAAFSAEWSKQKAYSRPDALTQKGPLGFNGTPFATEGSRSVWGVAAEGEVPLIAQQLSVRGAGRHDQYSDFGGVNVGQASVRYQPTREVLFRASYGKGFIAPSILHLYEGPQVTNPSFLDPTAKNPNGSWGANAQVSLRRVGNPKLQPEKADIWNGGLVWSPKGIKGLTLSADYWNINQKDVVSSADDYARIIAQRFWQALGSSDAARDAAARNPTTRAAAVNTIKQQTGVTVVYDPQGGPAGLGGLSEDEIAMEGVYRTNLAGQKTDGVDFGLNYPVTLERGGTVTLDAKATWTHKFDYQALQGEGFDKLAGKYGSGFEGIWPRWRTATSVIWNKRDVSAMVTHRHVQRVTIDAGTDPIYNRDYLPSFDTWDAQVSYKLPWTKTVVALGVENLGNRRPPQTSFALNNFVPGGAYDVKGRFWYVRAQHKF